MHRICTHSFPPREIKLPYWNMVLRIFSCLPYESLKLSLDKYLTWKTCFLSSLAAAIWVSESHSLSYQVCDLKGWRSYTFSFFPEFVAKTQNPSVYDQHFEEFAVPSLADFVDRDRYKMLLCLIGALGRSSTGLSTLISLYQRLRRRNVHP